MSDEIGRMSSNAGAGDNWERSVLEKIALAGIQEQRRVRRWVIFFKTLIFLFLFLIFMTGFGLVNKKEPAMANRHTALVELRGVIDSDGKASADKMITGLQEAFKDTKTQGVVL